MTVRIHWYWPFARGEEMALAAAFAHPGDELTVQVIDRDAAPRAGTCGSATIARNLPDVDRSARGWRWPLSRLATYLGRVRRREAEITSRAPDLVHYHYVNRYTDSFRRPSSPWVISVHDVEPHQPRLGRIDRALLARLHRKADGIIVHHEVLADRLHREHRVAPERITVVPHPVFEVDTPSTRPSNEHPRILCFGALRPNKGFVDAIELMDRPELAGFTLHIAGRGDHLFEQQLIALAAQRRNVTIETGFISAARKDELFRAASVVLLPYRTFASQSGVLHDAYGHGRPLVVTDVGAIGESVRADRTGAVVSNADEMVRAIIDLSGPEGDEPGRNGRRVADERSPTRVAEQLRGVYDRILA